ncbi:MULTISPECIES: methionine ABC transporter permease [Bifidobacterium]|jgi:D-methionine transport system permease protein|uniref:methionine ABC transporter permease n=1 Tax=Bifidobacterium TaxID=1678 RepID=UPI002355E2F3|nr:methionine ABC transporter permease [Bifidobacterium tibiigranuli]MCI1211672.1 ABC transporter permease [Bifidobacterium tibiigranuli]MCI1221570.1 ABC transporter permease [Bifidobacterium tibiigranuli]
MSAFFEHYFPNVIMYGDDIVTSFWQTVVMVAISFAFVVVLGTLLGILLVVISPGHIYENSALNATIPKIVNFMRSIPFIVLITMLLPVTRIIVGTGIGVRGAIVPMVIGHIPFFARQVEQALLEVDPGKIEMAQSIGLTRPAIVSSVLLRESRFSLMRITTLMAISQVNLSAMAGAVGGGGLGQMAIQYGFSQYMFDIAVVTLLLLVAIVYFLQLLGNLTLKLSTHRQ